MSDNGDVLQQLTNEFLAFNRDFCHFLNCVLLLADIEFQIPDKFLFVVSEAWTSM